MQCHSTCPTAITLTIRLIRLLLLTLVFVNHVSRLSAQQVPANTYGMTTNVTRTPSPGDGHEYIRDLDETVNPANGALSVRIAVHPPQGARLQPSDVCLYV